MSCEANRLALGAYVLDGLDASDRTAVQAHLQDCSSCTAEVADLAALPGLLSLLSVEEVEAGSPSASADGYDRLLARAEAQVAPAPARRWWAGRRLAIAAAAASLLVAIGALGLTRGDTAARAHTYAATAGAVHMSVTLTDQVRGTGLDVSVRGVAGNQRCSLVAVARDGTRQTISTWQVTYSGQAWSKAAMPLRRKDLSELVLVGDTGSVLVSLRL